MDVLAMSVARKCANTIVTFHNVVRYAHRQ